MVKLPKWTTLWRCFLITDEAESIISSNGGDDKTAAGRTSCDMRLSLFRSQRNSKFPSNGCLWSATSMNAVSLCKLHVLEVVRCCKENAKNCVAFWHILAFNTSAQSRLPPVLGLSYSLQRRKKELGTGRLRNAE